jgi:hypothetical protein
MNHSQRIYGILLSLITRIHLGFMLMSYKWQEGMNKKLWAEDIEGMYVLKLNTCCIRGEVGNQEFDMSSEVEGAKDVRQC